MNSRTRTSRSSALLGALALLLALHPLSGSALGSGAGLVGLMQAVACGCESCADEELEAAPMSCCDEEPAPPSKELGEGCACGHSSDFPQSDRTPLCKAPAGTGSAESYLTQHAALSAATLDPLELGLRASSHHGPPRTHRPAVAGDGTGEPLGLSDGTPARLAVLCVAQV